MASITFLAAVLLALVHVFAGQMRFLRGIPRSRWLSLAGGVSVAYVFVHILPDLSQSQADIEAAGGWNIAFLEHHVYLVALAGLAVFYGLERAAKSALPSHRQRSERETTRHGVFWLHIGSFVAYNTLIGYLLLHREEPGLRALLFFFLAIALHFVVNDFGLQEHYQDAYNRVGRWLLAMAVLIGWGIGSLTEIDKAALAVLFSFLAGGVILNVLKEELPEERQSRFWAFALGAGAYAILLVAL